MFGFLSFRHVLTIVASWIVLIANNAVISKADKGNSIITIIIMYKADYINRIMHFISNNNFTNDNTDLIKKFQKDIRSSINQCQLII
jgi:uncharacterized protein YeeX (DUF496 family)